MPVSGSAYTFSYATLGELVAWIIGWDLILELMLGASVVAQGWSTYFVTFLDEIGLGWPESLGPAAGAAFGHFNLAAFLLVAMLTVLIAVGIKESLRVNLVLVAIKLFIVLFVIVAGLFYVKGSNYDPFIPPAADPQTPSGMAQPLFQWIFGFEAQTYGVLGIVSAASVVFFAYIGFDVVATTAEEAKQPAEGPAARHHRLAGHLHGALRRGRAGDHRDGQVRQHRPRGGAGQRLHATRARTASRR